MAGFDIGKLAKSGVLLCAAFALSACASGAGMFVAGNDGGPSGFQDEREDQTFDEGFSEQAGDGEGAQILAASGNSLLPLPAGFRSGPPALAPTGSGPNLVTAAIGSPASTPLLSATVGALTASSPGVSVAVAGQPIASVSGGGVSVLGASPTTVIGGAVGTTTTALVSTTSATTTSLVSTTTAATNTLVSNVSGAVQAVTGALPGLSPSPTASPMTSMTPGTVPLPAVLSVLTRPAGL